MNYLVRANEVLKKWTDAARAAALETRRANAKGGEAKPASKVPGAVEAKPATTPGKGEEKPLPKPKKPLTPTTRAQNLPQEAANTPQLTASLKDMFLKAPLTNPAEKRALHAAMTYSLAERWRAAKDAGKESEQIDLRDQIRKLPIYHGVTIRSYLEPALILKDMAAKEKSSKRRAVLHAGASVLIRQQDYVANYYHMSGTVRKAHGDLYTWCPILKAVFVED